jgi:hypothetical protein
LNVADALNVDRGASAHKSNDFVALVKEQLSQVRTVLAGDSRNQSALGHRIFLHGNGKTKVIASMNSTTVVLRAPLVT